MNPTEGHWPITDHLCYHIRQRGKRWASLPPEVSGQTSRYPTKSHKLLRSPDTRCELGLRCLRRDLKSAFVGGCEFVIQGTETARFARLSNQPSPQSKVWILASTKEWPLSFRCTAEFVEMIFSHSCVSPINVLASFAGIRIKIRSRPAEDYKNRK